MSMLELEFGNDFVNLAEWGFEMDNLVIQNQGTSAIYVVQSETKPTMDEAAYIIFKNEAVRVNNTNGDVWVRGPAGEMAFIAPASLFASTKTKLDGVATAPIEITVPPTVDVHIPPVQVNIPEIVIPPVEVIIPEIIIPPVEIPPVSVDVVIPPVEVSIPPVDVNIPDVNVTIPPVEIPPVNVNIPPIEVPQPVFTLPEIVIPPINIPPINVPPATVNVNTQVDFPTDIYTSSSAGFRRLKVDSQSSAFEDGREFRTFFEFNIGAALVQTIKIVSPVNFVLKEQVLNIDVGTIRLEVLTGATDVATFNTSLPVIGKNRMTTRKAPYYNPQVTVLTHASPVLIGNSVSGGTVVDRDRVAALILRQSVSEGAQTQRGLPAGTYYIRLQNLGSLAASTGVFSLMWEERP